MKNWIYSIKHKNLEEITHHLASTSMPRKRKKTIKLLIKDFGDLSFSTGSLTESVQYQYYADFDRANRFEQIPKDKP